ncbi:MAG: hypothetical protein M3Z54_07580 [Gemmatimonadota bacterium]|nr:hypothetical protein [Gemmatimonadota bacterium]
MVPIYLPPVVVPHAVLEEEMAIIKAEGWYHVAGQYYASAPDADKMRRLEAERRVAERERLARICAWCNEEIRNGQFSNTVALAKVHDRCAEEFNNWWSLVTDDTIVDFDGEETRWGDLMVQDRKVCEFQPDGRLVGGYPF